ncbi:3'-5' exonuclease [Paenibacillus albiflavus]|uniref:3'-5' exonuclease n=1 Tax=Paenibacillus albiflavus TaxID=2545760 RepID=A0A4R4EDK8_9BACL|nr:3'-5' exonuclease [Paenibacillus albiflavus]TCZ76078.1 3'-5' exonuclease [Paenibacillus albiflavus]
MLSNITIFDFETTGLNPEQDRVIEMAAIRVRNGEIVGEFQTLVQHQMELPAKITEITGITSDQMRSGMNETLAFKMLRVFMGDSMLVAHNAAFDLQFLHWAMQRIGNKTFENPFLDTMTISRERHPYPHKLTDMCNRYGIVLDGAHRALNDVRGTLELLKAMHKEKSVEQYVNSLGYLNKYGPPPWVPSYTNLFGTDNRYA